MFFLKLFRFFNDPVDIGNLVSGSSAFSKTGLNIWKFIVHVLLKPGLENFEHYFTSVCDECICAVVWAFFGIAFLWDWNENWFSGPVATAEFSKFADILSAAPSRHHLLGIEMAQSIVWPQDQTKALNKYSNTKQGLNQKDETLK